MKTEVIKMAMKGGYRNPLPTVKPIKKGLEMQEFLLNLEMQECFFPLIAQDPLFWQALGKALEWSEVTFTDDKKDTYLPNSWIAHATDYFKLVLTGGDTEKFWNNLLRKESV